MLLNKKYRKLNILITSLAVIISIAAIISGLFILVSGILMMTYGFGAVYGIFAGFGALFSASQFTAGLEIAAIGVSTFFIGSIIGINTLLQIYKKTNDCTGMNKKFDDMNNDPCIQTSDNLIKINLNSTNCGKKESRVFTFFYRNPKNKRTVSNDNKLDLFANDGLFLNIDAPGTELDRNNSLEKFLDEDEAPAMEI